VSLDDDLAELEAADPAVREAAELLHDTAHSILSTGAENRRLRAELGSALSNLNRVTSEVTDLREANQTLRAEIDDRSRRLLLAQAELSTARAQLARIQPTEGATPA
jgi:hypothetical protein